MLHWRQRPGNKVHRCPPGLSCRKHQALSTGHLSVSTHVEIRDTLKRQQVHPMGGTLRIDKPPSRMFTEVTQHTLEKFKAVYHQTTKYSNPIIESVLYGDNRGRIYFYGDLA